jgi:thioredoxin 2
MWLVTCSNCGTKNRVDPNHAKEHVAKCGKCGSPLDLNNRQEIGTRPLTVTDSTFQREVTEAGGTILLDCWAPWCGPCRMITPIMEQLAAESNGRYRIGKLNVDENPRIASQFQIQSIPTMLIFRNGQLVERLVGAQPKLAIATRLMAHT